MLCCFHGQSYRISPFCAQTLEFLALWEPDVLENNKALYNETLTERLIEQLNLKFQTNFIMMMMMMMMLTKKENDDSSNDNNDDKDIDNDNSNS